MNTKTVAITEDITVVNSFDGVMHVHKRGCRDIAREIKRSSGEFDITITSQEAALREIWQDFLGEWDDDLTTGSENTKFFACVNLPQTDA